MSRLARDRTAEPVSLDQILRHERGQGNIPSADHEQARVGNLTQLINTLLKVQTIYTYIHTYIHSVRALYDTVCERG